jgi:hypothetical protein
MLGRHEGRLISETFGQLARSPEQGELIAHTEL